MIKVFFFGDVVGRSGREALHRYLPLLTQNYEPDLILANVENAAAGFGVTPSIAGQFFQWGFHGLTTGNHVFDKSDIVGYFSQERRILRPVNYGDAVPGSGICLMSCEQGNVLLVNLACRLFMKELAHCPFQAMDRLLKTYVLGQNNLRAIIVDLHGEATSEKYAFAAFVAGRVSLVVGTHTHVPTSDHRILKEGTGFVSDLGMCGDYDSILGMSVTGPLERFLQTGPRQKFTVATQEGTISGAYAEIDPQTGRTHMLHPVCLGPHLRNTGISKPSS